MYVLIKDNQIIQTANNPKSFFPNISFPRGGPSRAYLEANGVKEVIDGERKDQRFYWVTPAQPPIQLVDGVPTRLYVNTPKDIDQLKEQYISQVKENANRELAPTDWMVIRLLERNVDIPEDVQSQRANVISHCTAQEANISNCTTVVELMNTLFPVIEEVSNEISSGNTDE